MLVDALKDLYALPELLAQLGLPRSSYFYHRARMKVADKYLALRQTITDIFELNHRCYGYRCGFPIRLSGRLQPNNPWKHEYLIARRRSDFSTSCEVFLFK